MRYPACRNVCAGSLCLVGGSLAVYTALLLGFENGIRGLLSRVGGIDSTWEIVDRHAHTQREGRGKGEM